MLIGVIVYIYETYSINNRSHNEIVGYYYNQRLSTVFWGIWLFFHL